MDDSFTLSDFNQLKDFQCHICQKYFTRKFTLDMHLLIHKNVKPFPCPFCGKCFRQKGTLMRHKALHSINNLFHCSLCNRGFRQKNVFLYHLRHRHNVATETLDRRKYPTENYQSIMDTLPPFVLADSTAITSSEKHLDAMLFETLNNGICDSSYADHGLSGNNDQSTLSNDCNNDISNSMINNGITYKCSICFMFFDDFDEYKHHVEDQHNNEDILLDSKPILCSSLSECNAPKFPTSNVSELISSNNTISNLSVNNLQIPNLITSSIETYSNEKGDLSVPCVQGFENEEIQSHLQIPVKKVFIKDSSVNLCKNDSNDPKCFNFVSHSLKVNCDTFSSEPNIPLQSKNKTSVDVSKKVTNPVTLDKMKTKDLNSDAQVHLAKSFSTSADKHTKSEIIFLGENLHNDKFNSKSNYPCTFYKCKFCNEVFKKKIAYEYHRQMHMNSRAFKCDFCKSKFKSKQLLLLHTRSKHMKTFKCDLCSRKFKYCSIYTFHKRNCCGRNLEEGLKSNFRLPLIDLDKLLSSDISGIAGVIPICDNNVSKTSNIKFGIPIVSVEAMRNFSKNSFINSLEIKGLLK